MIGPGMIGTDELFRLPLLLHRQRRSAMAAYVAERLEAAVLLPRDDQGNAQYPVTDERPRLRQLLRMARDQWKAVKQPLFPREMLRVEIAGGGDRKSTRLNSSH